MSGSISTGFYRFWHGPSAHVLIVSLALILSLLLPASSYSAPTKNNQLKNSQAQQLVFNKLKTRAEEKGSTRVIIELNENIFFKRITHDK